MKILVVDDSALYRNAIVSVLEEEDGIEDIQVANNGKIALDKLLKSSFDLVTLDIEMPEMDGIETLKQISQHNIKTKIIVFSSLSVRGATKTIEALSLGANDFLTKSDGSGASEGMDYIRDELLPRIKAFSSAKIEQEFSKSDERTQPSDGQESLQLATYRPQLICIGSSTGGPDALRAICEGLSKDIKLPIVIVQHMPQFFTKKLAESLDKVCALKVVEASEGEEILGGCVYIAPGDYHMTLEREENKFMVKLNQEEKVCYVRPSVDVLFQSIARNLQGVKSLPIILTGMGQDGFRGCAELSEFGAPIVIQEKSSCTVWGMPAAIYQKKMHEAELSLDEIADLINRKGQ